MSTVLFCLLLTWDARPSRAEEASDANYQAWVAESALKEMGLKVEPHPDGKKIAWVKTRAYDVIDKQDPWPVILNKLHVETLPHIIDQELELPVGSLWDSDFVDEIERNLASNVLLVVAEVIPVKTDRDDSVGVLVVVKDLWSIRFIFSLSVVGTTVENLSVDGGEFNLFGRAKTVALKFGMSPGSRSTGFTYLDPRVLGSRSALGFSAEAIFTPGSSVVQGADIQLSVARPLFFLSEKWGYSVGLSYYKALSALYSSGQPIRVPLATGESIPYGFQDESGSIGVSVTRSLDVPAVGPRTKLNVTAGINEMWRWPRASSESLGLSAAGFEQYRYLYVPVGVRAGEFFVTADFFRARYARLFNLDRYALFEEFRLGPNATLTQRIAVPMLGGVQSYGQTEASVGWTGRGGPFEIWTAEFSGAARYQPDLQWPSPWVGRKFSTAFKMYGPWMGPGIWVWGARWQRQFDDPARGLLTLGGLDALRGFPAKYLVGTQSWGANLEWRSLPVSLLTAFAGAVAFIDLGQASFSDQPFHAYGSVGVGFRMIFPQFNRRTIRGDLAFPLETVSGAGATYVSFTFGQAF